MLTDRLYDDFADHPAMQLDQVYFDLMCVPFSNHLSNHEYAHCVFEPDDGTRYEFVCAKRIGVLGGAPFVFATNYGPAYPWNGNPSIHPGYATEKWVANDNEWTGIVIARFMNTVALHRMEVDSERT